MRHLINFLVEESTQIMRFFVYLEVHAQFDKQEIEIMNIFWFLLVFRLA